jgi:tetratricopeptide (TPR) repeat protein
MTIQNTNIPLLKLIFKGRLDFGNQRTYEMVLRHWHTRIETYFKNDILFKAENVFLEEEFALAVPQATIISTDKNWKSTVALFKEIAQFAVAGQIGAWWVANGQILDEHHIEPRSEKAAVVAFIKGRKLLEQGNRVEASQALSNAIEKFEKHALAYERRGYVNYKLQNYNDALYDFNKSIDLYPNSADPYYGRGKLRTRNSEWELAINDFDAAVKGSFAIQPLHWLSRFRKAECLCEIGNYSDAARELRFFLQRNFTENDPNHKNVGRAKTLMAKCEEHIPHLPLKQAKSLSKRV